MTPIKEVRRLSRFWHRAYLATLAFNLLVVMGLYITKRPPVIPCLLCVVLNWSCMQRSLHWREERLAIIANRKSFRRQ